MIAMDARLLRKSCLSIRVHGLPRGFQLRTASVPHCTKSVTRSVAEGAGRAESHEWDAKRALIAALTTCALLLEPAATAQGQVTVAPTTNSPAAVFPSDGGTPFTANEAPVLHDEDLDRWWEHDADAWLELTSEVEVQNFLTASSSPEAPLKLVELYATWCPACRAASPGLAAVATDPAFNQTCTFARSVNTQSNPASHITRIMLLLQIHCAWVSLPQTSTAYPLPMALPQLLICFH